MFAKGTLRGLELFTGLFAMRRRCGAEALQIYFVEWKAGSQRCL